MSTFIEISQMYEVSNPGFEDDETLKYKRVLIPLENVVSIELVTRNSAFMRKHPDSKPQLVRLNLRHGPDYEDHSRSFEDWIELLKNR